MTAKFERFDALLAYWLDNEGHLTISYEKLVEEMIEHDCHVGFNADRWYYTLLTVEPPLDNVASLLGERSFIDTFFPEFDIAYLKLIAFNMDNAKIASLIIEDDVQDIFYEACCRGKKEIVKLLVKHRRVVLPEYATVPEFLTCNPEVTQILLEHEIFDPTINDNQTIKMASENGHIEVVRLLLADKRVDPTTQNNFAIRWASFYGRVEVVRLLLSDVRVDPAAYNNEAIKHASMNGHSDVVRLLLADKRIDPTYAIRWASTNGHVEVIRLLLEDGRADPVADDNYTIRWACRNNHLEVVEMLLKDGRAIPDKESIKSACDRNHFAIVRLLLEDGRALQN